MAIPNLFLLFFPPPHFRQVDRCELTRKLYNTGVVGTRVILTNVRRYVHAYKW